MRAGPGHREAGAPAAALGWRSPSQPAARFESVGRGGGAGQRTASSIILSYHVAGRPQSALLV